MFLSILRFGRLGLPLVGALLTALFWVQPSFAAKPENPCTMGCIEDGRTCLRAAIDVKRDCYSACRTDESPTECREPCRVDFDAAHDACREARNACRDVCSPPPCKKACTAERKACVREALGGEDEIGCRKRCKAEAAPGEIPQCVKDCRKAGKEARGACKGAFKDCKQACE